jgi:hypothetical protein
MVRREEIKRKVPLSRWSSPPTSIARMSVQMPPMWLLIWISLATAQNVMTLLADSLISKSGLNLIIRMGADGLTHGTGSILCWQTTVLVSQQMYFQLSAWRWIPPGRQRRFNMCSEILFAFFFGTLIDLDHFLEAHSLSIRKATSLPRRPFGHNILFVLFLTTVLAFLPWDAIMRDVCDGFIIPLTSFARRRVALNAPAAYGWVHGGLQCLLPSLPSSSNNNKEAGEIGRQRLSVIAFIATSCHISRDAVRRGYNIIPWNELATPKISHGMFLFVVCVVLPIIGASLIVLQEVDWSWSPSEGKDGQSAGSLISGGVELELDVGEDSVVRGVPRGDAPFSMVV